MSTHKANHFLFILPLLASVALGYFSCQKNSGGPPEKQVPKTQEDIQAAQKEVEQAEQRVQALQEKVREAKERVKKAMAAGNPHQIAAAEDAAKQAQKEADEAEKRKKELVEKIGEELKKRQLKTKLVQETQENVQALQKLAEQDAEMRPLSDFVQSSISNFEGSEFQSDTLASAIKNVSKYAQEGWSTWFSEEELSIDDPLYQHRLDTFSSNGWDGLKTAAQAIKNPTPDNARAAARAARALKNDSSLAQGIRNRELNERLKENYIALLERFVYRQNDKAKKYSNLAQIFKEFEDSGNQKKRREALANRWQYLAQFWEAVAEDLEKASLISIEVSSVPTVLPSPPTPSRCGLEASRAGASVFG
ncbi:MAG: hypothetical protein ROO73_02165 [Roseivirga sp.]